MGEASDPVALCVEILSGISRFAPTLAEKLRYWRCARRAGGDCASAWTRISWHLLRKRRRLARTRVSLRARIRPEAARADRRSRRAARGARDATPVGRGDMFPSAPNETRTASDACDR